MPDESSGERTERATAKRRSEARKKGQVARSREIPSVTVMMTGLSALFFLSSFMYQQLSGMMVRFLKQIGTFSIDPVNLQAMSLEVLWALGLTLGPMLLAVIAVAVVSNFAQVGSLFTLEAIRPQISRLNFFKGCSQLVSKQSFVELAKSLGKFLIVGWAAYATVRDELPRILTLTGQDIQGIFGYVCSTSFTIFWKTFLVMVVIAALDYAFQRWHYEKSLRMTKKEVFEEYKQSEGDPMIKSRIRSIQRDLARRRMMTEVKKSRALRRSIVLLTRSHVGSSLAQCQQ